LVNDLADFHWHVYAEPEEVKLQLEKPEFKSGSIQAFLTTELPSFTGKLIDL
jgi:hypothetical protein